MNDVETRIGENCIVLYLNTSCIFPACATITRICGNTWYFNRLIVPKAARHKGFASCLMKKLIKLLDEKKIILINEVSGHGDLNNDQLVVFYKKYGFKETDRIYRLIRKPLQKAG